MVTAREWAPLPELPERALILMIGLPGSGKSSYLEHYECPSVSSDALREMLFGSAEEQQAPAQVFGLLRTIVKTRLEHQVARTFVDATNLSGSERGPFVRMAQEAGIGTMAIWMDTEIETCLERNRLRTRQVGEDVVRRMAKKLRIPNASEGVEHLYRVQIARGEWVY